MNANAYLKHFGWSRDCPPMKKGDRLDLMTLYGRGLCGWEGKGWTCNHPENADTEEGLDGETGELIEKAPQCNSSDCPIASICSIEEFIKDYPEYKVCDDEEIEALIDEEGGHMVLEKRPREAFVPNVIVIGLERWKGSK